MQGQNESEEQSEVMNSKEEKAGKDQSQSRTATGVGIWKERF